MEYSSQQNFPTVEFQITKIHLKNCSKSLAIRALSPFKDKYSLLTITEDKI